LNQFDNVKGGYYHMKGLEDVSNALAAAVANAGQSVVRIEARRRMPASGIVWTPDGVIVTASHVVRREDDIRVGLSSGEKIAATLVGRDVTTDLAVLNVKASDHIGVSWADDDDIRVGHIALALGRPGANVMATFGIVSALGESWKTPAGGSLDRYLQTDVVMYPGFSGGLLVNAVGEGMGMNTSGLLRGISLAVPHSSMTKTVETLLEHGRVRRGYLGVGVQPVRLPAALAEKLAQESGVLLTSVEPQSPGEKGGLVLGDTIVRLADQTISHVDDLLASLSGEMVGVEVPVQIVRGGKIKDLNVEIGERE
jgi:S1-C subfamily serine protease